MKSKLPKLPKLMNHGQIEAFRRDFAATFAGETTITREGFYNWASQTGSFYAWFWTRFERSCLARCENQLAYSITPDYRPSFMEWSMWELKPCFWGDFVRGLARAGGFKFEYRDCHEAMRDLYRDYFQAFKEAHPEFDYRQRFTAREKQIWFTEQKLPFPKSALVVG